MANLIGTYVSAERAHSLDAELERVARALRLNGFGLPRQLALLAEELKEMAVAHRRGVAGTARGTHSEPDTGLPVILTTREAAQAIGCGERNVAKLADNGGLRGWKEAGRWQFTAEDVHRYATDPRRPKPRQRPRKKDDVQQEKD